MVAYTSTQLGSGIANARVAPISGVGMGGRTAHHMRGEFTPTVTLTTADFVDLFDMPPRSRVISAFVKFDGQIDSNGAPTWAYNVGSVATPALIFAASIVGRTAGPSVEAIMAPVGRDFTFTAKTRIRLVPTGAPATFVAGQKITVVIAYTVEEPA